MKTAKQLQLLLEDAQEVEALLPAGWSMARIGDLAATEPRSLTDGPFGSNLKTSHYTEAGPRVIRLQNIGDGEFVDARAHISPDHFEKLRQHEALAEDVLIAMLGENLPRACLVPESLGPAIVKADCARLRVAAASMSPAFVMYALNAPQTRKFASALVHGVGRPRLGLGLLRELPVPLAPTREQIRLTQAVDSYLSRLDDAVATLERVQRNLKRYRASVLKAAVEGRLVPTEAELARKEGREYEPADVLLARILQERKVRWIEREAEKGRAKAETRATEVGKPWTKADDQTALARARAAAAKKYEEPNPAETSSLPELPEGWCWATIEQMAIVSGGLTKNSKRDSLPIQVPYLRVANVYSDELRLDEIKTIGVLPGEQQRVTLEPGDLLVVEGNGSIAQIGRVAIWDGSIDGCTHQNHLIKVRLTEVALGRWCLQWLLSPAGRGHVVKQASSTSGLHTLSISKVEGLVIPLCPREELDRIATEVDRLLTIAEASGGYVAVSELRASRLRQSILKWAFEGKLVDQDPNDEPASELLERIKAERENARAAAKAKKKPTRTKRKKKPA